MLIDPISADAETPDIETKKSISIDPTPVTEETPLGVKVMLVI
jgi:hypothetical protein